MKIISWNCNGAFRKKAHLLSEYDADSCIIQECENPEKFLFPTDFNDQYQHFWTGMSDRRGLGIFLKKELFASEFYSEFQSFHDFIFLKTTFGGILGVWTHKPNYIEDLYDFISRYNHFIDKTTTIAGDFNSNAIWDNSHGIKNHSGVVKALQANGLFSAWHTLNNVDHGKENVATLYFHKHLNHPFHIDYCFARKEMLETVSIGAFHDWIAYSDHMPLIITLKKEDKQ